MSGRYTDQFFIFEGKGYKSGTFVKFKQEYCDSHPYEGEKIFPYAKFNNYNSNTGLCYFSVHDYRCNYMEYAGYFSVKREDLPNAIEEITKPYEIELVYPTKLKDWECPEVMVMWPIYIIAMVLGTVFRQVGTWWAFCSILFFAWRHKKLWE